METLRASLERIAAVRGHPYEMEGWWCGHRTTMMDSLILFSAELSDNTLGFLRKMAKQLSACRQCTTIYTRMKQYLAQMLREQKFSEEDIQLALMRLREWDTGRLLMRFKRGAQSHVQLRETVLEALSSVELCMHKDIMLEINKFFDSHPPISTLEIEEYIGNLGDSRLSFVSGVAAVSVFGTSRSREWATNLITCTTSSFIGTTRDLDKVVDAAIHSISNNATHSKDVEPFVGGLMLICRTFHVGMWARNLTNRRKEVDQLKRIIDRGCESAVSIGLKILLQFAGVSKSELSLIISDSFASALSWMKTARQAYDGNNINDCNQNHALLLLELLIENIPASSLDELASLSSEFLPFLHKACKKPTHLLQQGNIKIFGQQSAVPTTYATARRVTLKFIISAYRHSAPFVPFEKTDALSQTVILLLQDKTLSREVLSVLATVLLTDARNVLRSIVGGEKACDMLGILGVCSLELQNGEAQHLIVSHYQKLMKSSIESGLGRQDHKIPWACQLWKYVGSLEQTKSPFFKVLPTDVRKGVLEILLEVHRTLGFVSPTQINGVANAKFEHACHLSTQVFTTAQCLRMLTKSVGSFLESEKGENEPWRRELYSRHCSHLMATESLDTKRASLKILCKTFGLRDDIRSDHLFEVSKRQRAIKNASMLVVKNFVMTSRMFSEFCHAVALKSIVYHLGHFRSLLRAGFDEHFEYYFDELDQLEAGRKQKSREALQNILLFVLTSWKHVRDAHPSDFVENMIRLVRIIPAVYDNVVAVDGDASSTISETKRMRLVTVLIEFGKHQDASVQKAWLTCIVELMKELKPSKANRMSIQNFVQRCLKSSSGLDLQQLKLLAKSFGLSKLLDQIRSAKLNPSGRKTLQSPTLSPQESEAEVEEVPPQKQLTKMEKIRLDHIKKKALQKSEKVADRSLSFVKSHGASIREQAERALERSLRRRQPSPVLELKKRKPKLGLLTPQQRSVEVREIETFYNDLLFDLQHVESRLSIHDQVRRESFFCAEDYVKYWWSILIVEASASVRPEIASEDNRFRSLTTEELRDSVRAPFEVADCAHNESSSFVKLTLKYRGQGRLRDDPRSVQEYVDRDHRASRLQMNDLVRLEVVRSKNDNGPVEEFLGIIGDLSSHGVNTTLTVHTRMPRSSGFPYESRRMKVSRVASLVSHTRLFCALAGISALPEILLRTLLNPREGWAISGELKRQAVGNSNKSSLEDSAVRRLLELKVLNPSQAQSINNVILRTGKASKPSSHINEKGILKSGPPLNRFEGRGSLSLIQGPPGTGKTSTILAILSALLSNEKGTIRGPLQTRRSIDGEYYAVAPFRILVCAPSNAAVDEIQKRLMEKGLVMPDGIRACPRVVRVGAGSTVQELGQVEVKSLAMQDPDWSSGRSEAENVMLGKVREQSAAMRENSQNIKAAHEKREGVKRSLSMATGTDEKKLRLIMKELTEELSSLHRNKEAFGEKLTKFKAALDDDFDDRQKSNTKVLRRVLNSASVVFSTLNASGQDIMRHMLGTFNVVIIDEAAQCIEPDFLVPFTGMCLKNAKANASSRTSGYAMRSSSQHCIMVGDPNQLPATVLSNNRLVMDAGSTSFFERAAATDLSEVHLLNVQYRMHPSICQFPSVRFYNGRLLCGPNVLDRQYHRAYHFDRLHRFGPLSMLDTSNCCHVKEARSKGKSSFNEGEVRIILMALVTLFRCYPFEYLSGEVAVLTPYSAQVSLIRQRINAEPELRQAGIVVSTVDGIQGREKPFVFLSTVRDGSSGGIGFVKDKRRMNVALTRPQYSMVVVGDARALSSGSEDWSDFVDHCKATNSLVNVSDRAQDLFPEFQSNNFVLGNKIVENADLPDLGVTTQTWQVEDPTEATMELKDVSEFEFDRSFLTTGEEKSSWQPPPPAANLLVPLARKPPETIQHTASPSDFAMPLAEKTRPGISAHTSSDATRGAGSSDSSHTRSSHSIRANASTGTRNVMSQTPSLRNVIPGISKARPGPSRRLAVTEQRSLQPSQNVRRSRPTDFVSQRSARNMSATATQSSRVNSGSSLYRPLTNIGDLGSNGGAKRSATELTSQNITEALHERGSKRARRQSTDSDIIEVAASGPRVVNMQSSVRNYGIGASSQTPGSFSRNAGSNPLVQPPSRVNLDRNNRLLEHAQKRRARGASISHRDSDRITKAAGNAARTAESSKQGTGYSRSARSSRPRPAESRSASGSMTTSAGRPAVHERSSGSVNATGNGGPSRGGARRDDSSKRVPEQRPAFSLADAMANMKRVSKSVARARGERD